MTGRSYNVKALYVANATVGVGLMLFVYCDVLLHSDSLLLMDTLFRDSLKTQVHPKRIHL